MNRTYSLHLIHSIESEIDDNVDAYIILKSKKKIFFTFFTLKNIENLMLKFKKSGECKGGNFFWAVDMVILDRLTLENMYNFIDEFLEDNLHLDKFTQD